MAMKLVPVYGGGYAYVYDNDVGPSPPPSYGPSYQDPGKGGNSDPGTPNWYDQGRAMSPYVPINPPQQQPSQPGNAQVPDYLWNDFEYMQRGLGGPAPTGTPPLRQSQVYHPSYAQQGGGLPPRQGSPSSFAAPQQPQTSPYTPRQQYAAGGGARAQQAQAAAPMQNAQQYDWAANHPSGPIPQDAGGQWGAYFNQPRQSRFSGVGGVLDAFYGQGETNYGAPVQFQGGGRSVGGAYKAPQQPTSNASMQQASYNSRAGGSQAYGIGVGNMASNGRRPPGSGPIGSVNMDAVGAFMQLPPDQQAALRAQGIGVTVNGQNPNTGAAPWSVSGGYNNPSGPAGKMQQLQGANQRASVGQAMNAAPAQAQGGFPVGQMSSPGRFGNRFMQSNMALASSNAQTRAGANQLLQGAAASGNMDRSKPMLAQYFGSKNFARSQALADQQDRDRNYGLQRDALDFNQMQALAQAQAQTQASWRNFL